MRAFATSWVKADILQMCRSLVDNCGLAAPFQGFEQYVLTRTSENMAPGRLIHRVRAYVATTCVSNDSSPTPLGRSSLPPRRSPTRASAVVAVNGKRMSGEGRDCDGVDASPTALVCQSGGCWSRLNRRRLCRKLARSVWTWRSECFRHTAQMRAAGWYSASGCGASRC